VGVAEIRGFLAFAAAVAAIAYLWVQLDDAPNAKAVVVHSSSTTTTLNAVSTTSTTTPEQAIGVVCDRAAEFEAAFATIDEDDGDGPVARLAAEFWATVLPDLPVEVRTETVAVVDYYESYLEVAEPFDHDPVRIIIEGDKERYEQLITRPAPGLETSRGFLLFVCGVEVPDKPWMSVGGFRDLEERLLDPDPLGR
jgi:hypothetical protein